MHGKLSKINGSQPILLDRLDRVWIVQSGSIALFAVMVQNGDVIGSRRYLCTIDPGEGLFCTHASLDDRERQILAVPIGQIELIQLCQQDWQDLISDRGSIAQNSIATWIEKISSAIPDPVQFATAEIDNAELTLKGISDFNRQILEHVDLLDVQETADGIIRLQDRQRRDCQITSQALGDLASTLDRTSIIELIVTDDPLLDAAGAVGRVMGITIRPPARTENFQRKDSLESIARASRLRKRQVLLQDNWWQQDNGPLVAYTNDDRPVALLPLSPTTYEVFDPVTQQRQRVNRQIAATISPVAQMFYRSLPERADRFLTLCQFALKGRIRDVLMIFFTGMAVTLLGMFTPQATATIIDSAIPDSDLGLLFQIGLGLFIAAAGTALFQMTQGFALLRVETVGDATTQVAAWDRLLNLPATFFRQYTTGDLLSRVMSVSTIHQKLGGRTLINLFASLFTLFYLGQLFYYNASLAWIAVVMMTLSLSITTISGVLLMQKVSPLLAIQGNIFGRVVQLINGISKLHIAGAEERAFAFWSKSYSQQVKLELSTQKLEDAVTVFNTAVPIITNGMLFWFVIQLLEGSKKTETAGLSIGIFLAFSATFSNFIRGSTRLSNTAIEILHVLPQWQRIQPILTAIPEVNFDRADPGILQGRISIDRVTFSYHPEGRTILSDLSFQAEPGEFIALVGSSGSGKSTLFRLLLGFETPKTGSICYDSQNLAGLNVEAVRRQLGVVLQSSQLNSASIFENIAAGGKITMEQAWEAALAAGLADDIAAMPMQLHTVVSEGGGNISGGQRQRLLIARALALKPRILLFDEATSALDNRTQAIVSESLSRLQVTRIIIAHRLSTIRNADRIYVLEGGQIIQQGKFNELAAADGLFAQLMARQIA
jgi:NHLM bacteriocin system ABC transporter ATP-binding protein